MEMKTKMNGVCVCVCVCVLGGGEVVAQGANEWK